MRAAGARRADRAARETREPGEAEAQHRVAGRGPQVRPGAGSGLSSGPGLSGRPHRKPRARTGSAPSAEGAGRAGPEVALFRPEVGPRRQRPSGAARPREDRGRGRQDRRPPRAAARRGRRRRLHSLPFGAHHRRSRPSAVSGACPRPRPRGPTWAPLCGRATAGAAPGPRQQPWRGPCAACVGRVCSGRRLALAVAASSARGDQAGSRRGRSGASRRPQARRRPAGDGQRHSAWRIGRERRAGPTGLRRHGARTAASRGGGGVLVAGVAGLRASAPVSARRCARSRWIGALGALGRGREVPLRACRVPRAAAAPTVSAHGRGPAADTRAPPARTLRCPTEAPGPAWTVVTPGPASDSTGQILSARS